MPEPTRTRTRASTHVSTEYKEQGHVVETAREEFSQDVYSPDTHPVRVRIGGSVTQNMGNYNSIRVEVSIELPCAYTPTAIAAAQNEASEWVDATINAEIDRATAYD